MAEVLYALVVIAAVFGVAAGALMFVYRLFRVGRDRRRATVLQRP